MCRSGNDVVGCGSSRDIFGTNLWAVAFVGDGSCVIRLSQGGGI